MGRVLDRVPDEHKADVLRVLGAGSGVSSAAIGRAMRDLVGEDAPSEWTIAVHRRGGCRCDRKAEER